MIASTISATIRACSVIQSSIRTGRYTSAFIDSIFWNLPWGYVERPVSVLERSLFDEAYHSIEACVRGATRHLTDRGRLYLGFSTTMGRWDVLSRLLGDSGCMVFCAHGSAHSSES